MLYVTDFDNPARVSASDMSALSFAVIVPAPSNAVLSELIPATKAAVVSSTL